MDKHTCHTISSRSSDPFAKSILARSALIKRFYAK